MVTRMGIREVRDSFTHVMRRVRAGESIEVTHDGEPVAVLLPYRRSRLDQLIAEGRATPGRPFEPPTRLLEPRGARTTTEIIEDDRAGR